MRAAIDLPHGTHADFLRADTLDKARRVEVEDGTRLVERAVARPSSLNDLVECVVDTTTPNTQ